MSEKHPSCIVRQFNCLVKLDPAVINISFIIDFRFHGVRPGLQEQEGQMFGGRAVCSISF